MCEINSREKIFLSKLEVILSTFDRLDELFGDLNTFVSEQPDNQQKIDYLLSDYIHRLENDDLTDEEMINIAKKIHDARLTRKDECATSSLIQTYSNNKNKLLYAPKSNRAMFRTFMEKTISHLHEDYKYRVLNEDDLNELKSVKVGKDISHKGRPRKSGLPDDEILKKCFADGMRNRDIAKEYNIDPSVVSRLRNLLGFPTRKYNKKG